MVTLAKVNADPEFQALPYEQQVAARRDIFAKAMGQDPEFQALPRGEKIKALNQIVFSPPAVSNPQTQRELNQISKGLAKGDEQAVKVAKKEVYLATLGKASLIANVADRFLISPFLEELEKSSGTQQWDHADILQDPDRKKIIKYFDMVLSQDKGLVQNFNVMKTVIGGGATLAEFALLFGLGAGSTFAPRGLGKLFTAPTRSILSNSTKLSLSAGAIRGAKLGQVALHAGATTSMGLARDITNEAINSASEKDPKFLEIAQKNLRWTGGYFLADVAMNLLVDVGFPMTKSALKIFKGWPTEKLGDFDKTFADFMTGKPIPPETWAGLNSVQREACLRSQATGAVMNNIEDMGAFEAMQLVANARGFRLSTTKKGIRITRPNAPTTNVSDLKGVNDFLLKDAYGRASNMADEVAGAAARQGDRWGGAYILTGKLNELPTNSKVILSQALAPQGGRYRRDQLEAAGKIFIKATGGNSDLLKGVRVASDGDFYRMTIGRKEIMRFPKGKISPDQERELTNTLLDKLAEFRGKRIPTAVDFAEEVKDLYPKRKVFTPGFVDSLAQERLGGNLLQEGNRWIVQTQGERLVFDSLQEAGDHVVRSTYNIDDFAQLMKERYGLNVRVNKDTGWIMVKQGPDNLDQAADLETLLARNPSWAPKIPGQYGPEFTVIDDAIGVRYRNKVATGNRDDLARFLDNFTAGVKKQTLKAGDNVTLKLSPTRKQFEVEIPQMSYRKTFDSVEEAQGFIKGWNDLDNLELMANKKGYRLNHVGGDWIAYSVDGNRKVARSLEDIKVYLRDQAPVPEWAPELSGLSREIFADVKIPEEAGVMRNVYGDDAALNPDYSMKTLAKTWVSPLKSELEGMVSEGGNQQVMRHYREFEKTRDFISGQAHAFYKLVDSAFVVNGKPLKKKAVQKVGMILGSWGNEDALKKLRAEINFTDAEFRAAENVRKIFGTDYMRGLSQQFDMSFDAFQWNYMPMFQKGISTVRSRGKRFNNPHSAIDAAMDAAAVPKMKAFFKHARYSELQKMATSGDIRQTLMGYYNLGMREKYLGGLLDELPKLRKTTDKRMFTRYMQYISQVGGIPQGWSEDTIRKISQTYLEKMGLPSQMSDDITRTIMNLGYTAALGLRPALVIRNMNQIWTMLAPWTGNDWVVGALKKVARDDGKLFEMLKRKNIIRGELPVFGGGSIDKHTPLGKIAHTALKWYGSSDDFTRAVGYVTGTEKFADALKRLKTGAIKNSDEFDQYLRLGAFGDDIQKQIHRYMDEGDLLMKQGLTEKANFRFSLAEEEYARELTRHAFFVYSAGNGPASFRGSMGKLFGMFGTYPVYYVDNVRRAMGAGSIADKLDFATRFIGNTTALYGAFKAFGIRMDAFKFWNPMMFTGGPFYEMFNTVLSAAGGDQRAMKNLTGVREDEGEFSWHPGKSEFMQWFTPFGFAAKDALDSVEYAKQDDPYRAFLTLTGFSLFDD